MRSQMGQLIMSDVMVKSILKVIYTRVPALSRGVVYVILRLAVLIQYWHVTHRQTDRHTHRHTMMVNTRTSLAPRGGKNVQKKG